ncbi:hypothetical protein SDC9_203873 [bioreactor metagenome]|uniref:Uncharacterized protein n=1 Tax=bioreactor metagenome TaxID=1076179 RepID=A0A645IYF4_9ZZZZ
MLAFGGTFEHTGILQHPQKGFAYRILHHFCRIDTGPRLFVHQACNPLLMVRSNLSCFSVKILFNFNQLILQTRRQNRQPHHFDQADVFFFDVLHVRMRVENAVREFRRSPVVAQNQIQFEQSVLHARNRRDRIMRNAIRDVQDFDRFIRIASPSVQDKGRRLR